MNDEQIQHIALEQLRDYEKNAKWFKDYEGDKWQELLHSIETDGILHALVVEPAQDGCYRIISGHQRVRAARQLELQTVPCVIQAFVDEATTERKVIAANLIQREYTYAERLRMASRWLELEQRSKGGRPQKNSVQSAQSFAPRDKVCKELGLHTHDIAAINALKNLPKETQAAVWAWIEEQNPNKAAVRKYAASLKAENKRLKKSLSKLRNLSSKETQLKKEAQRLREMRTQHPEFAYMDEVLQAFEKARAFMTGELSRIAHLPLPPEAKNNETMRMYARMLVSILKDYMDCISKIFIEIEIPQTEDEESQEITRGNICA